MQDIEWQNRFIGISEKPAVDIQITHPEAKSHQKITPDQQVGDSHHQYESWQAEFPAPFFKPYRDYRCDDGSYQRQDEGNTSLADDRLLDAFICKDNEAVEQG